MTRTNHALHMLTSSALITSLLINPGTVWACVPGLMSANAASAATLQTSSGLGVTMYSWHDLRNDLRTGTTDVENEEGQKVSSWRNSLVLDYNVYKNWTAILSLPYVYNSVSHDGHDETINGVGDLALHAKYALYRNRLFNASREIGLLAGIEFPTGSRHTPEPGEDQLLSATEQPGSNSTNFIIGGAYLWGFSRLSLYGDLVYEMYGHNTTYRFGNTFGARAGVSVPLPIVPSVSVTGEFIAHVLARDHSSTPGDGVLEDGKVENSGSETLYLAPGLQWRFFKNTALAASVQLPVYQHMQGTQLRTDYNLVFSLSTRFGAKDVALAD